MQQTQSLEIKTDPCETCLRFPECFGVDKLFCPLCFYDTASMMESIVSEPVLHRYDDFKLGAVLNNVICVRDNNVQDGSDIL